MKYEAAAVARAAAEASVQVCAASTVKAGAGLDSDVWHQKGRAACRGEGAGGGGGGGSVRHPLFCALPNYL